MDIPWGSDIARRFIANVGLITTNGVHGQDIMACEWVHQVSYSPALIAVSVHPKHATHEHIDATKEFGVNIASAGQSVLTSIAGRVSGKNFDKVKIAEDLGFEFFKAKKINILMVKNATVNLECKLIREIPLGSHTMFIGEIIEGAFNSEIEPLAYYKGRYWELNSTLKKPSEELRKELMNLLETNIKN